MGILSTKINPSKYLTYLFEKLPSIDFIQTPDLLVGFLPWAKNVQSNC